MSSTYTSSSTYTVADIERVIGNFATDLLMIADSSKALSQDDARKYAHDVTQLVKSGYLRSVDVTLLDWFGVELRAASYEVDTNSGSLIGSRPGGVRWPNTNNGSVRIILYYTSDYDDSARDNMRKKLEISWGPTSIDTSHSQLRSATAREYASNGFGLQRKDFTQ